MATQREISEKTRAREDSAILMRGQGMTFKAIGAELGVSLHRARQIYMRAVAQERARRDRDKSPFVDLTTRTANCLRAEGIHSMDDLREVFKDNKEKLMGIPNFGKASMCEVEDLLTQARQC